MTCDEAFNRGALANRDGLPRSANPHQPSVNEEAFLAWYLGWDEEEGPCYGIRNLAFEALKEQFSR